MMRSPFASLLALLLPLAAAAQGAARTAPSIDGTKLKPDVWSYTIRVLKNGRQQGLDFYSQMVLTPATYQGADAWLLVSARRTSGPLIVDSLFLAKRSLAPLHHAVQMDESTVTNDFSGDSVRAIRTVAGKVTSSAAAVRTGTLASTDAIEVMLPLLPLRAGWRQRFDVLNAAQLATFTFELAVTGEERVTVPAGSAACWKVSVSAPTGDQTWWVAKETGQIMRALAPAPKAQGIEVEMLRLPSRSAAPSAAAARAAQALAPATWLYGVSVARPGADTATFYTRIQLANSTLGSDSTWLLVSRRETPGAEILDSLVLTRATLSPVKRTLRSGLASVVHLFTPDSVRGTLITPNGGVSISLRRPPGLLASTDVFSVLLSQYPLAPGWRQDFDVINGAGDAITRVQLAVTGEQTVTVPAGTFPSWVVAITGDGAQQSWWVSKAERQLVQVRSESPRAPGTVVMMKLRSRS